MDNQKDSQPQLAGIPSVSANGKGSPPQLREQNEPSVAKSATVEGGGQLSIRNATGPRTPQGKERSKFNALKHGLLSKELLLKGESRTEYEFLLNGLREDLQPQGTFESVLVETLATLFWRRRRLLRAETAEVAKANLLSVDRALRLEAGDLGYAQLEGASAGELQHSSTPEVLRRALEILAIARPSMMVLDPKLDTTRQILEVIYGSEKDSPEPFGLRNLDFALARLRFPPTPGKEERNPANLKLGMYKAVSEEMMRLTKLLESAVKAEALISERNREGACVPPQEVSDRLLRYEANLSREFDRTLSQLERLQRMRMGQPVPPTIKVEVSQ